MGGKIVSACDGFAKHSIAKRIFLIFECIAQPAKERRWCRRTTWSGCRSQGIIVRRWFAKSTTVRTGKCFLSNNVFSSWRWDFVCICSPERVRRPQYWQLHVNCLAIFTKSAFSNWTRLTSEALLWSEIRLRLLPNWPRAELGQSKCQTAFAKNSNLTRTLPLSPSVSPAANRVHHSK